MQSNPIHITMSTDGYVSISGLTRADFERIGGDLATTYYYANDNLPERWHKKFVICDGQGAYLDLDFSTTEPPRAVADGTFTRADDTRDDIPMNAPQDDADTETNPWLLSGPELERAVTARRGTLIEG